MLIRSILLILVAGLAAASLVVWLWPEKKPDTAGFETGYVVNLIPHWGGRSYSVVIQTADRGREKEFKVDSAATYKTAPRTAFNPMGGAAIGSVEIPVYQKFKGIREFLKSPAGVRYSYAGQVKSAMPYQVKLTFSPQGSIIKIEELLRP